MSIILIVSLEYDPLANVQSSLQNFGAVFLLEPAYKFIRLRFNFTHPKDDYLNMHAMFVSAMIPILKVAYVDVVKFIDCEEQRALHLTFMYL